MSFAEILKKNIAPVLELAEEDALLSNGMHEDVAKAHRAFAKLTEEEQKKAIREESI